MAARAYSEADIVFSAWCHPDRFPDGVFFKVSRPLHRPAFFRHHRCWSGSGTDAMAFTIGQEPSIFTNGYLASHRRLLRGAGGPYFSRVVELACFALHSIWNLWNTSAISASLGSFTRPRGKQPCHVEAWKQGNAQVTKFSLVDFRAPTPLAGRVARCIGQPFGRRQACLPKPAPHPQPSPSQGRGQTERASMSTLARTTPSLGNRGRMGWGRFLHASPPSQPSPVAGGRSGTVTTKSRRIQYEALL